MAMSNKIQTVVGIIVALVVTGILAGYVLPIGVDAVHDANTTGWETAETELFELFPIFLVLVVLLVIVGWAIYAFRP